MKNSQFFRGLQLGMILLTIITSCENESSTIMENEQPIISYIIPESANDTIVTYVNSIEDLRTTLTQAISTRELKLLENGWKRVEECSLTRSAKKARQVRVDTVYVDKETVDYYSDPSVYANFNAKFSKAMVDSINKVVSSEYKISTNKTYICRWRLFGAYYKAAAGEQVTSRSSPLCALVPATKSSFVERGYSMYLYTGGNGNQYQMDSYQLRIQWENVNHQTIVLDIDWPFFPKNPSGPGYMGYQFIYAVSKRI